jgi:hypothetical protein
MAPRPLTAAARVEVVVHELEAIRELSREVVEWRYKILTRFALAVTGLTIALHALYEDRDATSLLKVGTFGIGVAVSVGTVFMDRRNEFFMDEAAEQGKALEEIVHEHIPELKDLGYYHVLEKHRGLKYAKPRAKWLPKRLRAKSRKRRQPPLEYAVILAGVYWLAAGAFLLGLALELSS